jgi:serine/threonine protein kinase
VQARLNHPNIAAFHSLTEHQGCPCIVMEYVDGQTLSDRIRFSGPLPMREALAIFQAVVEAVAYIHAQGIIHRDLKSNNIKITSSGRAKLLDFGIASSALAPKMTMTGMVVGALESLSPEQMQGQRADERSDIWALGVLLYEMVTGRMPFEAQSVGEICSKTTKGTYAPPKALNPSLTREVETLITRCLKKNPADRCPSAAVLLSDIRRAAASLSARPPQPAPNSMPWKSLATAVQNRRTVLVSLLAVLILAAIYFLPSPSALPVGPGRKVTIRTTEGPARVYLGGSYLGDTPLKFDALPSQRDVERRGLPSRDE